MRAALSLLALVIVAALLLSLARRQAPAANPPSPAASAATALPLPQAVGRDVQGALDDAARRTDAAASAALD